MKRYVLIVCGILLSMLSFAQVQMRKPEYRPDWMIKTPQPENSTFLYVVEHGEGTTQREALNQAICRVFQSTGNRIGQAVSLDEINRAVQTGTNYDVIASKLKIPINKVCEWSKRLEDNTWRVHVLCQVAVRGNISPNFVPFTECYSRKEFDERMRLYNEAVRQQELAQKKAQKKENSIAIVGSTFVPGLGQMLKGHYLEGALTLGGELALIGAGVGTYVAAKNKLEILGTEKCTYDVYCTTKKEYNGLRAANYTMYGLALAVHAFNMYRAYTLSSKKNTYAFLPVIIPMEEDNAAYGVCLTVNF